MTSDNTLIVRNTVLMLAVLFLTKAHPLRVRRHTSEWDAALIFFVIWDDNDILFKVRTGTPNSRSAFRRLLPWYFISLIAESKFYWVHFPRSTPPFLLYKVGIFLKLRKIKCQIRQDLVNHANVVIIECLQTK